MHEASLMQEVLETAEEAMRREGGTQLHRVTLRVGALAGVVPEALQFAFAAMKAGTPAAQAELVIEWLPLRLFCTDCALAFESENCPDLCPKCGSAQSEVRQGLELDMISLEISREG
jgi:hydrogenase nickel incorporation protein HypA/HybF